MLASCLNEGQTSAYLCTDGKTVRAVSIGGACPPGFKKMTLKEIILSSRDHCRFPGDKGAPLIIPHGRWIETGIKTAVDLNNVFDNNNSSEVLIQEIRALPETCDSMYQTLSSMCQKAQMKRIARRTHGLWGLFLYARDLIKYYLWNRYCNPSSHLKVLREYRATIQSAVPKALREVPRVLKERVLLNIGGFLEEIDKKETIRVESSKDINVKFLAKYHPDKYQYDSNLSEKTKLQADTYRQRIIVIKNMWEQFEKGTAPSSTPPIRQGFFLT